MSLSSEDLSKENGLASTKQQVFYSSHQNLLQSNTMSVATQQQPQQQSIVPQVPPGYVLVPQQQATPQQFQVPPGYCLMPIQQQPQQQVQQVPPGFMLVPSSQMQQQQQHLTLANLQQLQNRQMGTLSRRSVASDSDNDDAVTDISRFTFSKPSNFKVDIPADGNLYHFSAKKMAELFRQLKIEAPCIKACLKDKIDGKKFSRMLEGDLEHYGLVHPVVLHFRRSSFKRKEKFML